MNDCDFHSIELATPTPAPGSTIRNRHSFRVVFLLCLTAALPFAAKRSHGHQDPPSDSQASPAPLLLDPVDDERMRTVPLKVYLPVVDETDAEVNPHPVILVSHGLGGSREGLKYLGEKWSQEGFVVVHLQHRGSDESVWRGVPAAERMERLQAATGAQTFLDRVGDVQYVLDYLEESNAAEEHPLYRLLDLSKIGMSGHSFGASTTQAMAGKTYARNRSFADERLTAFFAMSPSMGKVDRGVNEFANIDAPMLCMTGTEDTSPLAADVSAESRTEVYQNLPKGEKFQLVFHRGAHDTFGNRPRRRRGVDISRFHPAIEQISTAFWNATLRQDEQALAWLRSADVREWLIDEDVWEWK